MIRVAVLVALYIMSVLKSNEQITAFKVDDQAWLVSHVVITYKAVKGVRFIKLTH